MSLKRDTTIGLGISGQQEGGVYIYFFTALENVYDRGLRQAFPPNRNEFYSAYCFPSVRGEGLAFVRLDDLNLWFDDRRRGPRVLGFYR